MKIAKPRLKIKRMRGKEYSYWVIETNVEYSDYYVLLSSDEWKRILKLYDAFLWLLSKSVDFAIALRIEFNLARKRCLSRIHALTDKVLEWDKLKEEEREAIIYAINVNKKYIEIYSRELKKVDDFIKKMLVWRDAEWKMLSWINEEERSELEK